ncbi:MAG: ABC transporter ATP-binding protein [Pyrinomonadaceae bacterium]
MLTTSEVNTNSRASSHIAIKASGISKRYFIGGVHNNSVRDAIAGLVRNPLRERREELWALRDVSFEVRQGERIGIIGRNGAGKSTILKILSRITRPTSGTAEIHGRVVSLLEVGTGFHSELSGRENVYLNGAVLGMRKAEIEAKFDEIIKFSEFGKFIDTPVKHYSSGMYMRLAFSVAAHLDPEVLIVDEVLAVGDSAFQRKCVNKMRDIARAGKTIFFVSHDMEAIKRLCSRVMWLDGGHVREDGEAQTVINAYLDSASIFTAESAAGMSINERLSVSGLRADFDHAVRERNVPALNEILRQVYITGSEADAVIEFELGQY